MQTVSNIFRVAFIVVAMATPAVAQVGRGDDAIVQQSSILFRKPLTETRELLVTRGPDREARVLFDLLGEAGVERIRAVYELRVQLASQDEPPITLTSVLIPVLNPAAMERVKVPTIPHELAVLDVAFLPEVVKGERVSRDELVIALRLNGWLAILQVHSLGSAVKITYPNGWQGFSTAKTGDPQSARLSRVDGLWVVDVLSGSEPTRLIETEAGKFEFEVVKRGGN